MAESQTSISLLVVVLDCCAGVWAQHPDDHASVLDQLCLFLNAYLALNHDNKLCVIGAGQSTSKYLFPAPPPPADEAHIERANAYQQFHAMNSTLLAGIKTLMDQDTDGASASMDIDGSEDIPSCHLASALSKGLCFANRISTDSRVSPSIIVLSASPDSPAHYVPLMNCIFSAQKAGIHVDACKFYDESAFLQQASLLTRGVYQQLSSPAGLVQHLLFTFLPPPDLRDKLALPAPEKVDFRAACFCHQIMVGEGFVCSVCLAIYCSFNPVCQVCQTRFPFRPSQ
ncbi:TFIIH subunit Tfb4/p34 [Blastocladiella britannica]|nr:TFIIH subunit Tfb4/p34 [Blastocladiella britannica]